MLDQTALTVTLFCIGAPVFTAVVIYYMIDQNKTGVLFRRKMPGFAIAGAA